MGFTYNGFFSVDFIVDNVTYNTRDSWGLVPLKKPIVKPPSITRDGQLTPGSNSWEFALSRMEDEDETYLTYLEIVDAVNGKRCTVRLYFSDHDSTSYKEYVGSVNVSDFTTDDSYSTISFDCNLVSSEDVEKEAAAFGLKYSILFVNGDGTEKNTFSDWFLKPEKRPLIESCKPRTNYVTTPGADGALDLTEVLAGKPLYDNAEGDWTFTVLESNYEQAADIFYDVVDFLNGKRATIFLENGNEEKKYEGRFTVSGIDISADAATFKIGYWIDPYSTESGGGGGGSLSGNYRYTTGAIIPSDNADELVYPDWTKNWEVGIKFMSKSFVTESILWQRLNNTNNIANAPKLIVNTSGKFVLYISSQGGVDYDTEIEFGSLQLSLWYMVKVLYDRTSITISYTSDYETWTTITQEIDTPYNSQEGEPISFGVTGNNSGNIIVDASELYIKQNSGIIWGNDVKSDDKEQTMSFPSVNVNSYCKIEGRQWRVLNHDYGDIRPTPSGMDVSGGWISLDPTKAWEIGVGFKFLNSVSGNLLYYSSHGAAYYNAPFGEMHNGKLLYYIDKDGLGRGNWAVNMNPMENDGWSLLEPDTWYFTRFSYDGNGVYNAALTSDFTVWKYATAEGPVSKYFNYFAFNSTTLYTNYNIVYDLYNLYIKDDTNKIIWGNYLGKLPIE